MFSSRFITLAAVAVAAFAGLAQAAPSASVANDFGNSNNNKNLNKVHYCDAVGFDASQNPCTTVKITSGACIAVPPNLNDVTSSFQPMNKRMKCTLYKDYGCDDTGAKLTNVRGSKPIYDLRQYTFTDGTNANDQLSSFKCTGF